MRRIKLSSLFSPGRLALLILVLLTLGLGSRVFSSPAKVAADNLATSTSASNVIVQYTKAQPKSPINARSLGYEPTAPFTLYGNGLLICGHDTGQPFTSAAPGPSPYKLPTSANLTQADVQSLIQQISSAGFFGLNQQYGNTLAPGNDDVLRVSLLSGDHYVRYFNDTNPPTIYYNVLNVLDYECRHVATSPYVPTSLTLRTLKDADAGSNTVEGSATLDSSIAATFNAAITKSNATFTNAVAAPYNIPATVSVPQEADQTIKGTAAAALVQSFASNTTQYVNDSGTIYELNVIVPLPKIKNVLSFSATPAGRPVRFVLLLPNSGGSTDRLSELQALAPAVQNWYCGQVGSCYTFAGVSVMRGSLSESDYECIEGGCNPSPMSGVLNAIEDKDKGTVYRDDVDTIVVPGWPLHDKKDCGLTYETGFPLAIVDLYAPTAHQTAPSYCEPGGTLAHEMGHTFGLDHTHDGSYMDPVTACDIGDQTQPLCFINSTQLAQLRATTYFNVPVNPSTLYAGQRLNIGHSLTSQSGAYRLTMQADGNLAEYNSANTSVWSTNTAGKNGSFLGMQTDGNAVEYNTSHKQLWATNTKGRGGDHLILQDDGNLVLESPSNRVIWSLDTGIVAPRHGLHQGETINIASSLGIVSGNYITSPSGNYQLILQQDGNLVDYNQSHVAVWTNNTTGQPSAYLLLQSDGNLVQYGTSGQVIWQSGTEGLGITDMNLQDDGNLVMTDDSGTPIWSIYTGRIYPPAPSILPANQNLNANQYLFSPSRTYQLIMQPDGNLVDYNSAHGVVWQTNTTGQGGVRVIMQTDGNFVMYNSSNQAVWSTGTRTLGGVQIVLQDDGNVVMVNASNQPVWSAFTGKIIPPAQPILFSNQSLVANQYLTSPSHTYQLIMQPDGNLVDYNSAHGVFWQSNTYGSGGVRVTMQTDGNFVMYTSANKAVWSSGTRTLGGDHIVLQDDGNVVMLNSSNQPVWSIESGVIYQPAPSTLSANQSLYPNQSLLSADGRYELILQPDGNLVLYNSAHQPIWQAPGALGTSPGHLIMQPDGNLVLYNSGGGVVWQAPGTYGSGSNDYLVVQSDGNMVVYTAAGNWVWQTATEGR